MTQKNQKPLTGKQGASEVTCSKFTLYSYKNPIDFSLINRMAINNLPEILHRWLPDGKKCGYEYVSRNPRRNDRTLGSFKVNLMTGRWSDFATGDKGGDIISLTAFLFNLKQSEAAKNLADMLNIGGK